MAMAVNTKANSLRIFTKARENLCGKKEDTKDNLIKGSFKGKDI